VILSSADYGRSAHMDAIFVEEMPRSHVAVLLKHFFGACGRPRAMADRLSAGGSAAPADMRHHRGMWATNHPRSRGRRLLPFRSSGKSRQPRAPQASEMMKRFTIDAPLSPHKRIKIARAPGRQDGRCVARPAGEVVSRSVKSNFPEAASLDARTTIGDHGGVF
jgi:hypothetical protein